MRAECVYYSRCKWRARCALLLRALLLRLLELSKAKQALKVHATATHCSLLVGKRSLLLHRSIGLIPAQILTINVASCAKTLLANVKLFTKELGSRANTLLTHPEPLAKKLSRCAGALLPHAKLLTKKLCACAKTLLAHAKLLTNKLCACAQSLLPHAETLTKKLGTKAKVAAFKV